MTDRTPSRFSWKRSRLLLAVVAVLSLVLGPAAVNGTLAGWKSIESSEASFTAGSLTISDLTCSDNSTPILGLLGNQLKLEWTGPPDSDNHVVEYEVTVVKQRLVTSTTYTAETADEFFVFTDGGALNVASYEMTVRAKSIGSWSGDPITVSGYALTGAILRCR